jgi:hypothetical protein
MFNPIPTVCTLAPRSFIVRPLYRELDGRKWGSAGGVFYSIKDARQFACGRSWPRSCVAFLICDAITGEHVEQIRIL